MKKERKNQKLSAIAWAAQIAGETYGKYASALSDEQKEDIYAKFAELLKEKRSELNVYRESARPPTEIHNALVPHNRRE